MGSPKKKDYRTSMKSPWNNETSSLHSCGSASMHRCSSDHENKHFAHLFDCGRGMYWILNKYHVEMAKLSKYLFNAFWKWSFNISECLMCAFPLFRTNWFFFILLLEGVHWLSIFGHIIVTGGALVMHFWSQA